jgi:hypothetical protein
MLLLGMLLNQNQNQNHQVVLSSCPRVRAAAAHGLAAAGPSTARTLLLGLFDPDSDVCGAVCDALDSLGDANIASALAMGGSNSNSNSNADMLLRTAREALQHARARGGAGYPSGRVCKLMTRLISKLASVG